MVAAPSRDEEAVRQTRRAIRQGDVLGEPGEVRHLAVGEVLPVGTEGGAGPRCRSTSPARSRSCSQRAPLDLVHVHEPFAPSVASAALRHRRALNVGTFHAPTERVVATQVARKLVAARLRAPRRAASRASTATADLLRPLLPRRLRVVLPGADAVAARAARGGAAAADRLRRRRRSAGRCGCSCARCAASTPTLAWEATVVSARGPSSSTPLRAELRERVALRRRTRRRGALAGADMRRRRVRRRRARARRSSLRAHRRRRGPARVAPAPSTRSCSATASTGCSSSPATPRCSPGSSGG